MKFTINGPLKDNAHNLMRKCGYTFLGRDEERNELIFARPPKGYPRFHVFIKTDNESLNFGMHLDQKRPIYQGTAAHAGEYEGKLLEQEAERIKQAMNQ